VRLVFGLCGGNRSLVVLTFVGTYSPYIGAGQLDRIDHRMSDLTDLTERILAFRDARSWKQFHNPKDVALSLVLEATEVLQHFQWKNESEVAEYIKGHKSEIGEELADVLYWVLLMSHDLGIDISDALIKKIDKNETKYPIEKSKGNAKKYTEL
jgi:dCTP diphosphatase